MSAGPSGLFLGLTEGNGEQSSAKNLTAASESWLKNSSPYLKYSICRRCFWCGFMATFSRHAVFGYLVSLPQRWPAKESCRGRDGQAQSCPSVGPAREPGTFYPHLESLGAEFCCIYWIWLYIYIEDFASELGTPNSYLTA